MRACVTGEARASDVVLHLEYAEALARERAMLAAVAEGDSGLAWMVWRTDPCIVVPQAHLARPGFEAAAAASAACGYPVHGRDTGGGAVVQGGGVVNLSMVFSVGSAVRDRIPVSYRILCEPVIALLRERGVEGTFRAVPGTMCDGAYNIVVATRKLAGTAQRWRGLGRNRPGEYAVLAHLAMFVSLDQTEAAAAINALYAGMGVDIGVEAATHVNWMEIFPHAGGGGSLESELDRACRGIELESFL